MNGNGKIDTTLTATRNNENKSKNKRTTKNTSKTL